MGKSEPRCSYKIVLTKQKACSENDDSNSYWVVIMDYDIAFECHLLFYAVDVVTLT